LKQLKENVQSLPSQNSKEFVEINKNISNVQSNLDVRDYSFFSSFPSQKTGQILVALLEKLKTTTVTTISAIHSASSKTFWVFFALVQIAFIFGVFFWKGLSDEKKKKY
jgi:hypothetical protein